MGWLRELRVRYHVNKIERAAEKAALKKRLEREAKEGDQFFTGLVEELAPFRDIPSMKEE